MFFVEIPRFSAIIPKPQRNSRLCAAIVWKIDKFA